MTAIMWSRLATFFFGFNLILGGYSDDLGLPEVVVKEHLGTVFRRVAMLDNSISYWGHTIVVPLPDFSALSGYSSFCTEKSYPGQEDFVIELCRNYGDTLGIYDSVRKLLRKDLNKKINIMNGLIPAGKVIKQADSLNGQRRNKRSPLDFIGTVSKNLFGTATVKDVETLKSHIIALETNPESFKGFRKFQKQLSSLEVEAHENFKLLQDGVNKNKMLINESFHEMDRLQYYWSQEMEDVNANVKALGQVSTIMHSINAHEVSTMLLMITEMDKLINSYNVLLKGYLPLDLIPPARIQTILRNITDYLRLNHPTFKILHTNPTTYYHTHSISFARTNHNIYIKLNIPISSTNLLFNIYKLESIPVVAGNRNQSFTYISDLPPYFGVTTDNNFYTEIDEVTFQACPGTFLKRCQSTLKISESSQPSCASALFTNDLGKIYDICKIILDPNPDPKQSYFINLNDDKVLISTLDTNWVETCESIPPRIFEGCTNCVVIRKCSCSLKANSFFLPPSIQSCSYPGFQNQKQVPNILAIWSYFKSVDNEADLVSNMSILDNDHFSLPKITLTRAKLGPKLTLINHETTVLDLKKTLSAINNNKTLYATPFDAFFGQTLESLNEPSLTNTILNSISLYVIPIILALEFALILKLYKTQVILKRTLTHRVAEYMTLATLAPKTAEALPLIDLNHTLETEKELLYLFLVVLAIASISIIIHLILLCIRTCIQQHSKLVPNDQETIIKATLTDLNSSLDLCVKKVPVPSSQLSIEVTPELINTPKLFHQCVIFPHIKFEWDFIKLTLTEPGATIELPGEFLISPIYALKYWKMKGHAFIFRITIQTGDQVQTILSQKMDPFGMQAQYIPLQQMSPLPQNQSTPV